MPVKVIIPTPLRAYAGKQEIVELQASTVGEALASLTSRYSELKKHLYADDGRLRSFVNVYVNDEDIRYLQKDATKLREGDTVSIVPSIAGGAQS
jgi:MoaD family protein